MSCLVRLAKYYSARLSIPTPSLVRVSMGLIYKQSQQQKRESRSSRTDLALGFIAFCAGILYVPSGAVSE